MGTQGAFGYKIGRKIRLMYVHYDADMLWSILVREIYVLMKHYGSIDSLREAFNNLLDAKGNPSSEAIEKCKRFTDLEVDTKSTNNWYCLTRHCQNSFINILESGYIYNNGKKSSLVFLLDFNTNTVRFYGIDYNNKETEYEKATIDEIMEFDDMPKKTYTEIVSEMNESFEEYDKKIQEKNSMIEKINEIIQKSHILTSDELISKQANDLLDSVIIEKKMIEKKHNRFYNRLDALNMIDHSTN